MKVHGALSGLSKHHVQVDGGMALSNLAAEVEKVTGVPKENQKLILRGKTITAVDHSKTLQGDSEHSTISASLYNWSTRTIFNRVWYHQRLQDHGSGEKVGP